MRAKNQILAPTPADMLHEQTSTASSQLYVKIPNVTGLYRHAVSGRYYGVRKLHGRRKERSLGTTDRKIAERRLADWVRNLDRVDVEVERTTFRQLLERFAKITQGKSASTRCANRCITKHMEATWPQGLEVEVRDIRPSHLDEFLALHERRLRNVSFNKYAGFLKQLFTLAVNDRIISENPFDRVRTGWKPPQAVVRKIPTVPQFEAIVACIRSERFTDHAEDSADFVEFLGLAGLGQAEAASLTWGDVDWELNRLNIRRHKTDTRFYVPLYAFLRPLLEKLFRAAGHPASNSRVFAIKDPKKALAAACRKLGLRRYSQRNIRQCLIVRLLKARVHPKLVAKYQGHQDGGKLIIDTYSEVIADDDAEYERRELAKLVAA